MGGRMLARIPEAAPPFREGAQNLSRQLRHEERSRVLRRGHRGVLRSAPRAPGARPRSLSRPQHLLLPGSGRPREPCRETIVLTTPISIYLLAIISRQSLNCLGCLSLVQSMFWTVNPTFRLPP